MKKVDVLLIGGGPTGLGAACRLQEKGQDWALLEEESGFGGLACSFVDDAGFTWDMGGHVQFSHYDTFDRFMDQALGEDGWLTHQRESWVWLRDRFVPYPFQNNLHRLDPEERWACVDGLLQAAADEGSAKPENFEEWMLATFGAGITDIFMRPYNYKVWAHYPHAMDYGWIGERVAVPKLRNVLKSICTGEDEVSWGPNAVFRFPLHGGTGSVWRAIGETLPADRVNLGTRVTKIDARRKVVVTESGEEWNYSRLINTVPLNHLIHLTDGEVVGLEVAESLVFSATNVVGIGVDGPTPENIQTKCWMYFPENNSPYYRVTVFSNYSHNNVARPGEQWSLMTETAESSAKPVNLETLEQDTIDALMDDKLLPRDSKIVSVVHKRLAQGYPTPFLGRDNIVDPILRAFEEHGIYSRGRFGAWKYEVANQDHSFAQGYECVERLTNGGGAEYEPTLFTPTVVNSQRNP